MDRDADNSDTRYVSNVAIGLPSENRGSRESRDGSPEGQQVSSFEEIYPPCSPDMSEEEEEGALLDDEEEDNSTEEVKKVVASFNVARVPSQNVVGNYWGKKGGGAYSGLQVIACVFVDLNAGDVTSMNHRSTLLDTEARLIPPRNAMTCLGILGCMDKLSVLALNYHDNNVASESAMSHIQHGPLLVIFDGNGEGRRSTIRCAFDPGGDTSPMLLLSTLFVASWFPP